MGYAPWHRQDVSDCPTLCWSSAKGPFHIRKTGAYGAAFLTLTTLRNHTKVGHFKDSHEMFSKPCDNSMPRESRTDYTRKWTSKHDPVTGENHSLSWKDLCCSTGGKGPDQQSDQEKNLLQHVFTIFPNTCFYLALLNSTPQPSQELKPSCSISCFIYFFITINSFLLSSFCTGFK